MKRLKINKKAVVATLALTATMLLFSSCGADKATTEKTSAAEEKTSVVETSSVEATTEAKEVATETSEAEVSQAGFPLELTTYNFSGDEVKEVFDKAPEKVITYGVNNIETLIEFGLEDKVLVAMDVPSADELLPRYQETGKKVASYSSNMLTVEDVISAKPDFILGWYSTFYERTLGEVSFWQDRNINTYMNLSTGIPNIAGTVESEMKDFENIGKIFGKQDKAKEINDSISQKISNVEKHLNDGEVKAKTALILEDYDGKYATYASDSIGGDIAIKAGLDILAKSSKDTLSAEDVIDKNPEIIFAIYYGGELTPEKAVATYMEDPKFSSLQAVQNKQVYPLDLSYAYAPGIRIIDALDYYISTVYPELSDK